MLDGTKLRRLRAPAFETTPFSPSVAAALEFEKPDRANITSRQTIASRARAKLHQLLVDERFKEHGFQLEDIEVADFVGLGVSVKARALDGADPLIAEDPHRHASIGQGVQWISTAAGLYADKGFERKIQGVEGYFNTGWNAKGTIGLSVLAPFPMNVDAAKKAAMKSLSRLPLAPDAALDMARGTEVVLTGQGHIGGHVDGNLGFDVAALSKRVNGTAHVGLGFGRTREMDVSLRIKRLDGNRVLVCVGAKDRAETSLDVHGKAALGVDAAGGLDALLGESLKDVTDLTEDKIAGQLNKWLDADVRAVHQRTREDIDEKSFVIDLGTAAARQAYGDLLGLDTRKVFDLATSAASSVTFARRDEHMRGTSTASTVQLGDLTFLDAVRRTHVSDGTIETPSGKLEFATTKLDRAYAGFVSRRFMGIHDLQRELITTRKDGGPLESTYHLRAQISGDAHTSRQDVRKMLVLAQRLGVLENESLIDDETFLGGMSTSDRTLDVFISDAGLRKLADATPEQVTRAFADAHRDIDEAPGEAPWLKPNAKYAKTVKRLLNKWGPWPFEMVRPLARRRVLAREYQLITGRKTYSSDRDAYRQTQRFIGLISKMKDAADPKARAKLFAQHGERGIRFARALAAIADLVGKDNVMVRELTLTDTTHGRTFNFCADDTAQDLSAEIKRARREFQSHGE